MSAGGAEADAAVVAAAAALARAEAVGLRLRLEGAGRVHWRCRGEPPAGVLAELRRHRDAVVRLLAERQAGREAGGAAGAPYAPHDPCARAPGGGAARTEAGDAGLGGVAAAVRAALADGAEREADPYGWLVLVRPDGRRCVMPPGTVARLDEAGLLPALPEARETVEAARYARPPSWSETEDVPVPGDRCVCGGRRWWCNAEAPRGWWCWACHPPQPLPADAVREVLT